MIDSRSAPYAARVALGALFIAHALLKYYVFTLPGSVQFFQSIGLPGALAHFTFWAELLGGGLILAGLYSRWVSAALGDGRLALASLFNGRMPAEPRAA